MAEVEIHHKTMVYQRSCESLGDLRIRAGKYGKRFLE